MRNLEYILARRSQSEAGAERGAIMMRIAAITVALGLAVMILTLAVFMGFRSEISSDFRGFASDIAVIDVAGFGRGETQVIEADSLFVQQVAELGDVSSIAEYGMVGVMIKSGDNVVGLQLKGIGEDYPLQWWTEKIVEGSLPDVAADSRSKQLFISQASASSLEVGVGDKIELLYLDSETKPRRDSFRIAGIYSTGMEEMDRTLALADVRDVRRLAGWADTQITGYDVMLRQADDAEQVASTIEEMIQNLPDQSGVVTAIAATTQMRYPVVFDWLKAHVIIAQAVIIIMMVVLLFNMAAAMLIMVFDRIGMIGILKAQGMRNAAIRRIFLYRAALLFLKGAVWGNVVGLTLVAIQALWHPIKLDPNGYMLSHLPVSWDVWWWVALNVATLIATVVVMVLPSAMVARIKPEQSLKYKL
ncbi:MAG: ABC transporter permease [Alistipes sp.]|nr:ABC transporter permease [Alistipes sp.]